MKGRIEYIDQLKGLAMLMVMFGHLLQFAFGIPDSPWERILEAFDLPLFFFVSGFFCIKKEGIRCGGELSKQILKRMRAYLLPLISVGTLYFVLTNYSFHYFVLSGGGKLWFLYTLFWLAVICLMVCSLISVIQKERMIWLQMSIDIMAYGLPFVVFFTLKVFYPDVPSILPWGHIVTYYPYFVLGLLVRKYDVLEQLMQSNVWLYTMGVVCFVVGVRLSELTNKVLILLAATGAIVVLWHYFSNKEKQNVVTRTLGVIGRHTLAIYVFHYFFIPDLRVLSDVLSMGNSVIIHTVACLLLCACIIPACILIEKFVERSPLLAFLLLGKRIR